MEPVLVLTIAIASLSLGLVAVTGSPRPMSRPARVAPPPFTAALCLALLTLAARPRAAAAEVPPPIVRLGAEPQAAPSPPPDGTETHTVVAGDCLWRIAARVLREASASEPTSAEVARFWPRIYQANRDLIGDDPNLILVGQVLVIPEV